MKLETWARLLPWPPVVIADYGRIAYEAFFE